MDNEIFEMVTQSLMEDRISRIMSCVEEYQAAKLHERANNCPFCILSLCNFFHCL